jgi:hypothetical protein
VTDTWKEDLMHRAYRTISLVLCLVLYAAVQGYTQPQYTMTAMQERPVESADSSYPGVGGPVRLTPIPADHAEPPTVALILNQVRFNPGETLNAGIDVTNPGPEVHVEAYLGAILPDGVTVVFMTPDGFRVRSLVGNPAVWPPYVADAVLPEGWDVTLTPLVSHTFDEDDAGGTYQMFACFTIPGAFSDGSSDEGDLVTLTFAPFQYSPSGLFARMQAIRTRHTAP